MSAYVVDDKVINTIIGSIYFGAMHDQWKAKRLRDRFGFDPTDEEHVAQLGRDLFALNCQAVDARYGEGQAEQFRPLDYEPSPSAPISAASVYKAAKCLLCQCSEGSVPETALYRTLYEYSRDLAEHVAETTVAYQAAQW